MGCTLCRRLRGSLQIRCACSAGCHPQLFAVAAIAAENTRDISPIRRGFQSADRLKTLVGVSSFEKLNARRGRSLCGKSSCSKVACLCIDSKGMNRITLLVFGEQEIPFWRNPKIAWCLAIGRSVANRSQFSSLFIHSKTRDRIVPTIAPVMI